MKRWMTSLAPNRRTKFVSFTSRLLGKCPQGGSGRLQGRAGRCGAGALCTPDGAVPRSRPFQRPAWLPPPEGPEDQSGWRNQCH